MNDTTVTRLQCKAIKKS